jgi:hypothetical protein
MSTSILTSVKKGIGGIIEENETFDPELIMHINGVLATLTQLGVGPDAGFQITDKSAKWEDFVGDDPRLNFIQSYVTVSVKLIFDPPTIGAVYNAYESRKSELEYRILAQAAYKPDKEENQNGSSQLQG